MPTAHIEASKPVAITKYQSPVAVATNHYKLNGVKQHKCIILQFWRSKVQKGSDRAEAKWRQSCVPSETPVRSIFLPFRFWRLLATLSSGPSDHFHASGLTSFCFSAPFSLCPPSPAPTSHSAPHTCLPHHPSSSDSAHPSRRLLGFQWAHTYNPGEALHPRAFFNLRSPFCHTK